MSRGIGRRRALRVLGVATLGPSVLAACDDGGGEESGALSCNDSDELAPAQRSQRRTQAYIDHAPNPEESCVTCRFYTVAPEGRCGSCQVLAGPIHPEGYCNLWAATG